MTRQKLPEGAYAALEGLQAQATAATASFPGNDKKTIAAGRHALTLAHAQMKANTVWVDRIVKAITNNELGLTVVTADVEWLESTFAEKAVHWPIGETMAVKCPHCKAQMQVDIANVKEWSLPWRPVDCEGCRAVFELSADGTTVLVCDPLNQSMAHTKD